MNKKWIDEKLKLLSSSIVNYKFHDAFLFEPTNSVYSKLESGFDQDLQCIANTISNHLELDFTPDCIYEWGLKMAPEVAGQISCAPSLHYIQIPFFYAGKKYAVGNILAHEVTHSFLFSKGIIINDAEENEMFTDLATVYLGLGKFLLNGLLVRNEKNMNEVHVLGYLSPELIYYAYKLVCESRDIDNMIAINNLIPEAIDWFNDIT